MATNTTISIMLTISTPYVHGTITERNFLNNLKNSVYDWRWDSAI